jgi:hypothetical protein
VSFNGIKWPGRDVDNSSAFNIEVQNEKRNTSTLPFMAEAGAYSPFFLNVDPKNLPPESPCISEIMGQCLLCLFV